MVLPQAPSVPSAILTKLLPGLNHKLTSNTAKAPTVIQNQATINNNALKRKDSCALTIGMASIPAPTQVPKIINIPPKIRLDCINTLYFKHEAILIDLNYKQVFRALVQPKAITKKLTLTLTLHLHRFEMIM